VYRGPSLLPRWMDKAMRWRNPAGPRRFIANFNQIHAHKFHSKTKKKPSGQPGRVAEAGEDAWGFVVHGVASAASLGQPAVAVGRLGLTGGQRWHRREVGR
jgi:hypothetical protein